MGKYKYFWKKEYKNQNKWRLCFKWGDYIQSKGPLAVHHSAGEAITWLTIQSEPWFEMYFGSSSYGNVYRKELLKALNLDEFEEIWTEGVHISPLTKQERVQKCSKWKKRILETVQKISEGR